MVTTEQFVTSVFTRKNACLPLLEADFLSYGHLVSLAMFLVCLCAENTTQITKA